MGWKARQFTLRGCQVLVSAQDGVRKTIARQQRHLIDQDIASSANFAAKTEPATQELRLTMGSAIGEVGEVQVNALHAIERERTWIGVVGQFKPTQTCILRGVGLRILGGQQLHGECQVRRGRLR